MDISPNQTKTIIATAVVCLEKLLESSDSEESDDEDIIMARMFVLRQTLPREIVSNFLDIVEQYPDEEFKRNFRVERTTYVFLLEVLVKKLTNSGVGRPTKPPHIQLYVTLWFFANPDSYRELCSRFGVKNCTAVEMVRRVVFALYSVRNRFIHWPQHPEANEAYFEMLWGFPGVVGAVDGTHINIPQYTNTQGYVNRKGQSSIQLQVTGDHEMKFIHCYTGEAGSLHDARVFRRSGLQDICNSEDHFPNNTHLIGDATFSVQCHLLVPWKNNGHLTPKQTYFNTRLSRARLVVERAIGLLKGRWRRILRKLPMFRDDLIPYFIMACCVLHNVCLFHEDLFDYRPPRRDPLGRQNVWVSHESRNAGIAKRNEIGEQLYHQA